MELLEPQGKMLLKYLYGIMLKSWKTKIKFFELSPKSSPEETDANKDCWSRSAWGRILSSNNIHAGNDHANYICIEYNIAFEWWLDSGRSFLKGYIFSQTDEHRDTCSVKYKCRSEKLSKYWDAPAVRLSLSNGFKRFSFKWVGSGFKSYLVGYYHLSSDITTGCLAQGWSSQKYLSFFKFWLKSLISVVWLANNLT